MLLSFSFCLFILFLKSKIVSFLYFNYLVNIGDVIMAEVELLKQINDNVLELRKEVADLKECFHEDLLELSAETKKEIVESRKRSEKDFVRHKDVIKEFS